MAYKWGGVLHIEIRGLACLTAQSKDEAHAETTWNTKRTYMLKMVVAKKNSEVYYFKKDWRMSKIRPLKRDMNWSWKASFCSFFTWSSNLFIQRQFKGSDHSYIYSNKHIQAPRSLFVFFRPFVRPALALQVQRGSFWCLFVGPWVTCICRGSKKRNLLSTLEQSALPTAFVF